jgi:CubicO group peptidase (beta-lactamase class C family)
MNKLGRSLIAGAGAVWLVLSSSPAQACLKAAGSDTGQNIKAFENGLLAFPQGPAEPNAPAPKPQTLAERMTFYRVPGVSLAVVQNRRVEWAKGYGEIKAGSGKAVTPDTLFECASTTKALVAAVVLHYVAQGRFDLDADVNAYLKSWKVPDNEFTTTEKVTLRRLLTHRAGLPKTNMGYDDSAGVPTLVQVVKGEVPAENKAAVPIAVPGSRWEYSNVGYVLIQLVLEDALGRKLESIMSDVIYKPLGMTSTTLTYPLPLAWRKREAMPHDADGREAAPAMHVTAQAQGGLMSTPSDLAKVLIELMQAYGGASQRLLTREMAQAMLHAETELDPRLFGTAMGDALGMFVKGQGPSLTVLHPGNNYPGSICWLVGFPERGQGAIVMLNGNNGELLALEILSALGRVYGWPPLMNQS